MSVARCLAAWVTVLITSLCSAADNPILPLKFQPYSASETQNGLDKNPLLLGDRFEYDARDRFAQFYLVLPSLAEAAGKSVKIELRKEGQDNAVAALIERQPHPKAHVLIRTSDLPVGAYTVTASVVTEAAGAAPESATFSFTRSDKRSPDVPFPADGMLLQPREQKAVRKIAWPMRASVPLPKDTVPSADRLSLLENGKPVPAQIATRAKWGPGDDASPQWLHLDFTANYRDGKPSEYRLKLAPDVVQQPKTALTCAQGDELITVDNGLVRFQINRKAFAGIGKAWFDASGKGKYDESKPVIGGAVPGGPYVIDGRLIRFDAFNDKNTSVAIEEQGPNRVTIAASGWYVNPEGRVDPFCQYKTRITLCANEPMIRVTHHTILTFDTRLYRIKDLGFSVVMPDAARFVVGIDGKAVKGDLPKAKDATVFVHQDRHDHVRVVGHQFDKAGKPVETEGKRSDGWASVTGGDAQLSILVRDVWEKFPKEIEMSTSGIILHPWPAHGRRAFDFEEELKIENIYKFWCFHQHGLMNLNLPSDYFDRLGTYPGMTENIPAHALNGNGQGMAVSEDFALIFTTSKGSDDVTDELAGELDEIGSDEVAQIQKLFDQDPIATTPLDWNTQTRALGNLAAADMKQFGPTEEAFEQGMLSYMASIDRGQNYGMWIYADTHTYWDVDRNAPQLHRVWHNSHYHEVGWTWLDFFRTGNVEMLGRARAMNDHYRNVTTVNYADVEKGQIKFHIPGAMYHCKGCTPWGSEAYGMERRDTHAGLWGHWVDPDAHLWAYLIDGNARAGDLYEIWHQSCLKYGLLMKGTRREANTTMAIACNLYTQTWDADILPAIHGLGRSLREDEPLDKQYPGPLWHPMWINRYYELTRDPKYPEFILKYARLGGLGDTWTIGLAALAYDLSGDKTYLTQHFDRLSTLPRTMYHAKDDPYDWFGEGPGPIGFRWGEFGWGYFLAAMHKAGIDKITPSDTIAAGTYPCMPSRFDVTGTPPSVAVFALEEKDDRFDITFEGSSLGGDLHPVGIDVFAPSGKPVFHREIRAGGSSHQFDAALDTDGETGLYRVEYRMHEAAIRSPSTSLGKEATQLVCGNRFRTNRVLGYLEPLNAGSVMTLKIESDSNMDACNYIVTDAKGATIATGSLFRPRNTKEATITLDPSKNPLPWKLDIIGPLALTFTGAAETDVMLMSNKAEDVHTMAELIRKQPKPKTAGAQ